MSVSEERMRALARAAAEESDRISRLTPGDVVGRLLEFPRRPLLPWPELGQDLAMLAYVIDQQRAALGTLVYEEES